ncbi:BspA family leucine-rich repeat surface protein [Mycoplasmopsis anatis]|uniref:Lipoprotein n=1 Tax=Mycoplasmopsis anatis 1340 TaxID=1034808 RepID=F9QDA6_9BACT|nr:BspA family leucine-rich repeat surface protein [Mycoplasmopsis anatis]EGS29268.1 lipoprotein [Mycoplasmopsis anatis 1340]VEU73779.1 Mycoplasma protein of uncharacterised function, DUF285 [Mycoplasmopsis anatis]
MKFKPTTKEELRELIKNEEIYLGEINTELITDMSRLFVNIKRKNYNGIEKWDTSNVTTMFNMFYGCQNFNQPLNFDTSNVTDMYGMFSGC